MRLLCFSDIHGRTDGIAGILKSTGNIDIVVLSGDITQKGNYNTAESIMSVFVNSGLRVLAVPGNMDTGEVVRFLEDKRINLHEKNSIIDNIGFIGLGGSVKTPMNTPLEISETEMEQALKRSYGDVKETEVKVLITHTPPKRSSLDRVFAGIHAGSEAVRNFIENNKIDLCICGHIHESGGEEVINGCMCVNTGAYKNGNYCIADIGLKGIKIERRKV
ncbi:MAG: YfcE family phosphodiesterase [Spirochaetes bacterium]|nr:YfcE family phosphodiesterase [Spirochaetota bacterium]